MNGGKTMQGLGYTPVCSSSCLSKTATFDLYGITAPFFRGRFCNGLQEKVLFVM